jgi:hypothetical protein
MRTLVPFVAVAALLFAAGTGDATPRASLPAGVTSWWPGEGDGTDVTSGHDAVLDGTVGFAPAMVGQGFVFDDLQDIVRVPDNADLHPGTGSFTIDAWIKTTNGADALIARHYECSNVCAPGTRDGDWQLQLFNHAAYGFIRDNAAGDDGGQEFVGTTAIDDGVFHHVALVRDIAANKGRLYVDGVLQNEQTLDPTAAGDISDIDSDPDPVTIGGGWEGGTTNPDPNAPFTGIIDEVHWWRSTALTGDQLVGICTAADPAPVSSATAPAAGTVGQPLTVNYTASGGVGGTRVTLLVRAPGDAGFTEAATDSTNSGSFTYTPTAAGAYGFATRADDASCGHEAAPADPDATTTVTAPPVQQQPPPPVIKPPAPTPVPITQIATLPSPHVCVSRRHFRIHIKGVKGVVKAVIKLTGVPARTVTGKALGLPIDLRGLPKGKVVVKITITTKAGKRLVGKRTYHTCASKRIIKKKKS